MNVTIDSKGKRVIRLTSTERTRLQQAGFILGELGRYCQTSGDACKSLWEVKSFIGDDGVYSPGEVDDASN
jgi:hypothetical protein